jgi:4-amino-4-deoxy-L-arabinose transferase-like glycosyltransferase
MRADPFARNRPALAALLLCVFLIWFGTLETRALFWPDEGRYAEIASEMLDSGDFVTPRLNGLKYFEKPPLQYWLTAFGFWVFHPDEWTARLWPATCGFALVVISVALWWRWRGPAAGLIAGSVLVSAWGVVFGAQILTLDMGLAFFLCLALLAFIAAHRPNRSARAIAWSVVLVWVAMACAVLSKGLIGVVLPGLALGVYAALERDASILKSAFTLRGIAIFLVLTLPWFVLVQRANPEFFDLFFVEEHFRRFTQPGHGRPGPWWYFLPIVAVGFLPWTGALPGVLRDAWNAPRHGSLRVERLLMIWAVAVIAFFSASHSKLPAYTLPALPALAWLVALASPERHARIATHATIASIIAGVAMAAFSTQLGRIEKLHELGAGLAAYPPFLAAGGSILVAGGMLALASRHRLAATVRIALLAVANVAAMQVLLAGAHVFDAYFSAEQAIDTFVGESRTFPREIPFYSVEMLDQSVAFYLGRPVTLVAAQGELANGIAAEPQKFIADRSAFEARWRSLDDAFAVMSPATYRELAAAGLPMTIMATDPRRVFVARGRWPQAGAATPRKPGT